MLQCCDMFSCGEVQRMHLVYRHRMLRVEQAAVKVVQQQQQQQQQALSRMAEALQQQKQDVQECIVCRDAAPTFTLIPCGHMCYYCGCAAAPEVKRFRECPVCRRNHWRSPKFSFWLCGWLVVCRRPCDVPAEHGVCIQSQNSAVVY